MALVILVVALTAVVLRDHSFWFGSDDSSIDSDGTTADAGQLPTQQTPATQQPAVRQAVAPAPASQQPVAKSAKAAQATKPAPVATHAATTAAKKPATVASTPVQAPVPTPAPASSEPTVVRSVLPPIDVEVVAGDKHSTLRPGSNVTKVEIPKPGTTASKFSAPATNAAERERLTTTIQTAQGAPAASYPLLGQHMNVQGSVILQALIGADGIIENLHVLSGPSILTIAAQQAVREWHFKPYVQNGQRVETTARITVNFNIKIADSSSKEQVSQNIILVSPGAGPGY